MEISQLKEKLGEDFAWLETYVNDLLGQRDAARKESVEGRKALKGKVDALEVANRTLMEKLGIESLDEVEALPPAKGQAEALKQLETRLKAKDAAIAEKDQALSALALKHRDTVQTAQLTAALAAYDWIDRDAVAALAGKALAWQDDELVYNTAKGAMPLSEGVQQLVAAKPHLVKTPAARGSGYNPTARGGEAGNNPWAAKTFNLTEQLRMSDENPSLAAHLKAAASAV